jgi:hypothetical protein
LAIDSDVPNVDSSTIEQENKLADSPIEGPENEDNVELALETAAEANEKAVLSEVDHPMSVWPEPLLEDFDKLPNLGSDTTIQECQSWIKTNKKVSVRAITWNLMANPPVAIEDIQRKVIPENKFHIYVIGTEECENSIAYSMINPSKDKWLAYLEAAIGPMYLKLRSHTLQAIHITLFVHKFVAPFISDVTTTAVAAGLGNTLGNKGGVSIFFNFGATSFLFTNAHLAAHQNLVSRRNADFNRINTETPILLKKQLMKAGKAVVGTNQDYESVVEQRPGTADNVVSTPASSINRSSSNSVAGLESCADRVVFMGDLNYRIRGNRYSLIILASCR